MLALAFSRCIRTRLPWLDANRFARAQGFVVDGKHLVADFEAGRVGVERLGALGLRPGVACVIVIFFFGIEKGLPFAEREEDFLVVISGIVRGLDHEKAELAGVGAAVQVRPGHRVRVIPARPGRARRELIADAAVRRHHGSVFFLHAIDFRRE